MEPGHIIWSHPCGERGSLARARVGHLSTSSYTNRPASLRGGGARIRKQEVWDEQAKPLNPAACIKEEVEEVAMARPVGECEAAITSMSRLPRLGCV